MPTVKLDSMDPLVTSAIISGGAGLMGNLFGIGRGGRETRRNKELMKYQNEMNLAFWNKQNEYNRPINQMKRFKEAGLNPALMYGQGNPGNASNLQSANYTPHKEAAVDTSLLQNAGLIAAQVDAIKTDIKGKELDIIEKGGSKKQRQAVYDEAIKDMRLKNAQTKAQTALIGLDRQLKSGQIKLQKEDIKLAKKGIYSNTTQTILNALNLDLNSQEGKEQAQMIIYGLIGSKIFSNLTGGFRELLEGLLNPGKPGKRGGKNKFDSRKYPSDGKIKVPLGNKYKFNQ